MDAGTVESETLLASDPIKCYDKTMNTLLAFLFVTTTGAFELPHGLLDSVCYVETKHDVSAYHPNDGGSPSIGVCQVKLSTARWMGYKGDAEGLQDPAVNVYYAGKYLKYQISRYNSVERGVIAYNRGNAKGFRRSGYSDKVLKQWKVEVADVQNRRYR